jgi:hypothetical protein
MLRFQRVLPVIVAFALALSGCGVRSDPTLAPASRYWARASFCWQNLTHFQLRGRGKAVGESLVAEGPFVLWGTRFPPRLRGDMYGPDGRPVMSFHCDSLGFLVYFPGEGSAVYHPGGLAAGRGHLSALSLLSLVRTGFPAPPEHWIMAELYRDGEWRFEASGDTAVLKYAGGLFPSGLYIGEMEAAVTRSSWHDEYRAWPTGWKVTTPSGTTEFTVTSIDVDTEPWEEIWILRTPVPVDTLESSPPWRIAPESSIR